MTPSSSSLALSDNASPNMYFLKASEIVSGITSVFIEPSKFNASSGFNTYNLD